MQKSQREHVEVSSFLTESKVVASSVDVTCVIDAVDGLGIADVTSGGCACVGVIVGVGICVCVNVVVVGVRVRVAVGVGDTDVSVVVGDRICVGVGADEGNDKQALLQPPSLI